ncbi:Poly(A) ribonuclease pop2 [Psilocybe cubensis]|uniref:Poly(A) ribonuclease pop2 n=1 Tax=Psilocybe cubensis TaxID=181762 RepID=A0ACB8HHA5_PSICU|nr:Poly(A) ribonuclease pop2 [Psilocybe cubensis]KAH9487298.1 Poly(A) ribonuclease pop2 [Psilocybe cubensis]
MRAESRSRDKEKEKERERSKEQGKERERTLTRAEAARDTLRVPLSGWVSAPPTKLVLYLLSSLTGIRDVWAPNLEAEMRVIRDLIEHFPYVAMDTEFLGVVARQIGNFKTSSDYHYQTMRCNVDLLKIIQVGITLANEDGEFPQEISTWHDDMFTPDSVEQLQKAGIDFGRHEEFGILPNDFAELMITSGMVLSHDTKWISFRSGYDFGYFVKVLTAESLPTNEDAFFLLLKI